MTTICLAAGLLLGLVTLGSAELATAAKQQRVTANIYGDADAKLSMVVQKSKSGRPERVKGLEVTDYDLTCRPIASSNQVVTEVDFSFPSTRITKFRKGKYAYGFTGEAGDGDHFSAGFSKHGGSAEGYFSATKSGKLTKLEGFLSMGAFSPSVPGLSGLAVCADPVRDNPFQKLHGSFTASLR
ncbi:MAG: hypothetical protein U0R51_10700 [Solirubrobacterales bacterium]